MSLTLAEAKCQLHDLTCADSPESPEVAKRIGQVLYEFNEGRFAGQWKGIFERMSLVVTADKCCNPVVTLPRGCGAIYGMAPQCGTLDVRHQWYRWEGTCECSTHGGNDVLDMGYGHSTYLDIPESEHGMYLKVVSSSEEEDTECSPLILSLIHISEPTRP